MASAWGSLKKSSLKYAVLDGEYMARLVNSPVFYQATGTDSGEGRWKLFGWDGVHQNTRWSGTHSGAGDQNIRGFFCGPTALGVVAGLPLRIPKSDLDDDKRHAARTRSFRGLLCVVLALIQNDLEFIRPGPWRCEAGQHRRGVADQCLIFDFRPCLLFSGCDAASGVAAWRLGGALRVPVCSERF